MPRQEDPGILQAAILGYQQQLNEINEKIADLRRRLGKRGTSPTAGSSGSGEKKSRISAEGRARIAAAQRRRWAAAKKQTS